jgi:hypothetical protein
MDIKKKAFIKAYQEAFGNITVSAKAAGIDRRTYTNWIKSDPEFKAAIDAIEPDELIIDFAENALMKKISKGDTTAIIFTLKTKGKKRGYVERQEVTGADGKNLFDSIQINIIDSTNDTGE